VPGCAALPAQFRRSSWQYGNPETTLSSFDQNIKDAVFKEVTGLTLEQFRALRDTFNFFDTGSF
jgi:hypothetical protein